MSADRPFVVRDNRRRGFFMVFNDLYDQYGAKLGPYGLAVYMALSRYSNRESECWPSYQRIADGTGMSRRQVVREMQKLEALGLVAMERSTHFSNVYILLDTGDSEAQGSARELPRSDCVSPLRGARRSPPSARKSSKQDKDNKYLPDELMGLLIR